MLDTDMRKKKNVDMSTTLREQHNSQSGACQSSQNNTVAGEFYCPTTACETYIPMTARQRMTERGGGERKGYREREEG